MLRQACVWLAWAALMAAMPARAEWLEARSRHFIIYADSSDAGLRRQSEALERLDWGLRHFLQLKDEPEIESRKVTVFIVPDEDIKQLCRCSNALGFYISNVTGSLAFSGRGGWGDGQGTGRMVLFHEYAHHLLLGTYQLAFPTWYVEGFAEFASTMKVAPDSVQIGIAANHRAGGLLLGEKLTAAQMFDPMLRRQLKSVGKIDSFYGRGWLMTHFVTFKPERFAQFNKYVVAINRGTPSIEAARQAFGDLDQLDRDLNRYLRARTLPALTMRYGDATVPPVAIRRMTPGEAALIDLRMLSVRGVGKDEARKVYAKAAPIAARFPVDAVAQGWLAEMAFDAGFFAQSDAASTRAIATNPKSVQALLYRGRVKLQLLQDAKSTDEAAWNEARRSVVAANRADPDDAEPLFWYWSSFVLQGKEPPKTSIEGLYRAQILAPQDKYVRLVAARTRLEGDEVDEAKLLLRPVAYDPHADPDNAAVKMLAALEAGQKGPEVVAALDRAAEAADKKDGGD